MEESTRNSDAGAPGLQPVAEDVALDEEATHQMRRTRRGVPNRKWSLVTVLASEAAAKDFRRAMEFKYTASGQTNTLSGVVKLYTCRSHVDCPAQLRIRPVGPEHLCETSGAHAMEKPAVTTRDIQQCFLADLEMMFASGATPQGALDLLRVRHSASDKSKLLPSIEQVRNRKQCWKGEKVDPRWRNLSTYAELFQWANTRMMQAGAALESVTDRELLVLNVFKSTEVREKGEDTFGMVLSCRGLLNNLRAAHQSGEPVSVSCDGTYRLAKAGWTLINFGVTGVVYDPKQLEFHQRFFPCLFGFVRSECEPAFSAIFEQAKRCSREYFGFDLLPTTGSLDASTPRRALSKDE